MISLKHLVVVIVVLAGLWAMSLAAFPLLPEAVPVHWDLHGEVDRLGSRAEAMLLLPSIATAVVVLVVALTRLGPYRNNLERSAATIGKVLVVIAGALAAIQALLLLVGLGYDVPMTRALCVVLGLLFAAMGNWLGKVRRNFWIGIRTPWTLASDVVWERTHRIGGRLMMALGILTVIAGIGVPPAVSLVVLLGGSIALAMWALAYSCMAYRKIEVSPDAT